LAVDKVPKYSGRPVGGLGSLKRVCCGWVTLAPTKKRRRCDKKEVCPYWIFRVVAQRVRGWLKKRWKDSNGQKKKKKRKTKPYYPAGWGGFPRNRGGCNLSRGPTVGKPGISKVHEHGVWVGTTNTRGTGGSEEVGLEGTKESSDMQQAL